MSGKLERFFDAVNDAALRDREADTLHRLAKEVPVLSLEDGGDGGAQQFDAVLVQGTPLVQLYRQVKGCLSAEGGKKGVGAFTADNLDDGFDGEGLDVGGVGEFGVGHDGSWVGVDEDDSVALVAQSAAGLRPRVIELGGLPDNYRTRADDQDAIYVVPAWQGYVRTFFDEISSANSSKR